MFKLWLLRITMLFAFMLLCSLPFAFEQMADHVTATDKLIMTIVIGGLFIGFFITQQREEKKMHIPMTWIVNQVDKDGEKTLFTGISHYQTAKAIRKQLRRDFPNAKFYIKESSKPLIP